MFSFRLAQTFLDEYSETKPEWGFTDEAGNSIGEITFLRSYSRLKEDGSKETWAETCQRVVEGTFTVQREHCRRNKLPWDSRKAQRTAQDMYDRMFHFKWSPPGRGIANMGAPFVIEDWDAMPLQNCAFTSTKYDFSESMHFLMLASMNGVGVGFDVLGAGRHKVKGTEGDQTVFEIPDTREGWAEALKAQIDSHINGTAPLVFDYSQIRSAGALIKRFGGTASGPAVLEELLDWLKDLFEKRKGDTLTTTDIVDIANKIGTCVVSGSSRRSAELALGPQTEEYMDLKDYEKNPERGSHGWMSNNSVESVVGQSYAEPARRTILNGEPGYIWMDTTRAYGRIKDGVDNKDHRAMGFNPCCLSADTTIMTMEGPRRISDLEGIPFEAIVDGTKHSSNGSWVSGVGDVYSLRTVEGYELKLTPEHRIKTASGDWVEAQNLLKGDQIMLNNHRGFDTWGRTDNYGHGYLLGLFVGDGNFGGKSSNGNRHGIVSVWDDGSEKSITAAAESFASGLDHRSDWAGFSYVSDRTYQSMSIGRLPVEYGLSPENKHDISALEEQSSEFYRGFLRGLFDADGHVEGWDNGKGLSIRLGQSDYSMMQSVQRMLLRLGIKSTISQGKEAGMRPLPNGRGGHTEYFCKESFRLIIGSDHAKRWVDVVGFGHEEKARKCQKHFESRKRFYHKPFLATVLSFEFIGKEEVWDAEVADVHAFDANGIYAHNSEQPLEDKEVCTLVETYPSRHDSVEDYLKTLKVAYLYGKTVTLMPCEGFEKTNSVVARNRRIGLSQTGITTYVEDHGVAKWRDLCEQGYQEIKRLDDVYSEWLCVRNSIRTTTVKPSGSVSLLPGVSPGVHWNPASGYYIRRVTMGPSILLDELKRAGYPVEESVYSKGQWVVSFPVKSPFSRSERDVTIWEKVALAAEAQHWWSDNGVSVTVSYNAKTEAEYIEPILSLYEGKLKAVSFLPMSTDVYAQMPYEEITEDQYNDMCANLFPLLRDNVYSNGEEAIGEKFCTTATCEMPAK